MKKLIVVFVLVNLIFSLNGNTKAVTVDKIKEQAIELEQLETANEKYSAKLFVATKLIEEQSEVLSNYKTRLGESEKEKSGVVKILLWSIGSIIIMIFTFLAVSIYFNYRIGTKEVDNISKQLNLDTKEKFKLFEEQYKNDFKLSKDEIGSRNKEFVKQFDSLKIAFSETQNALLSDFNDEMKAITESNTKLMQKVQEQLSGYIEEQRKDIKSDTELIKVNFQKQLDNYNDNYNLQISSFEKNTDRRFETIENRIKLSNEDLLNKLDEIKKYNRLSEQKLKMQTDSNSDYLTALIYTNSAMIWDVQKVNSNTLMYQLMAAELYIKGNKGNITFSFLQIIETSKKIDKFSEYIGLLLKKLIEIIPDNYDMYKEELTNIYNQKIDKKESE